MTPYLAPALVTLRSQINARWPGRDKASDGWIGDAAHAARVSDHNPSSTSEPPGMVRALDIDVDGIDVPELLAAITSDQRTRYVISNRRIWHVNTQRWDAYTGNNPHDKHVHISVRSIDGHDRNRGIWKLAERAAPVVAPKPAPPLPAAPTAPTAPARLTAYQVRNLQRELNQHFPAYSRLVIDGDYGPRTTAVVREFQRRTGLVPDGIVGPRTIAVLARHGINI